MSNANTARPLTFTDFMNSDPKFAIWYGLGRDSFNSTTQADRRPLHTGGNDSGIITRDSALAFNAGIADARLDAIAAEHRAYSDYRNGVTRDHYTAEIAGWSDPTEYDWDYTDNV
jgi:hypothetical protein